MRHAILLASVLAIGLLPLGGCSSGGPADWSEHTHGLPFVVGYERGVKAAEESGKPTLFFVTTTWCGWCKRLARDNFDDPSIRPLLEQFTLVLVDGDTEHAASRKLNPSGGVPHIVIQSPDGEVVQEITGYRPPDEFRELLQQAVESSPAA